MKLKEQDDGNCKVARLLGKEACLKDVSPRTETPYKADDAGQLAPVCPACGRLPTGRQHSKALNDGYLKAPGVPSLRDL